jgi:hypothetical protein
MGDEDMGELDDVQVHLQRSPNPSRAVAALVA